MELPTPLSCLRCPPRPSSMIAPPSYQKQGRLARKVVAKARKDDHAHHQGKHVDENMIVLRMRIKKMKMLEPGHDQTPSNWMEWEKKYFATYYIEDIFEAMGLLQSVLMNTRPSFALGMLAVLALSVSTTTSLLLVRAIEFAQTLASGFHNNAYL